MQKPPYEIEYKYLVDLTAVDYLAYPYAQIQQAYLATKPVIRIRQKNQSYLLTVKGRGLVEHIEYELPISREEYESLALKAEGHFIRKKRYFIPYLFAGKEYTIELDIFTGDLTGLVLAEVEFTCLQEAQAFLPPTWFLENVTCDPRYHNSYLSQHGLGGR